MELATIANQALSELQLLDFCDGPAPNIFLSVYFLFHKSPHRFFRLLVAVIYPPFGQFFVGAKHIAQDALAWLDEADKKSN
ncbi:MAG TPA: hypothetical protein PLU64_10765 [Saprospiraceae bacterium]|nr:hypothetical protein [Saprospiraceae bacterium]